VTRAVFGASGLLVGLGLGLLVGVSGCEEQATTPPSQGNQGGGLSQNPGSVLGRSAKTAKDVANQAENRQAETAAAAGEMSGETGRMTFSGLSWPVPSSWRKVPPASNFLAGEYRIDGAAGEARMTVSTFGGGSGGSVDMNVQRWEGQFAGAVAKTEARQVAGSKVTLVSIDGTMRGGSMGGPVEDTPNTSLRGALIEGPQGLVVIKLTGPKESVAELQGAWDAMIQGMTKQ
jgi:hypothetical protein